MKLVRSALATLPILALSNCSTTSPGALYSDEELEQSYDRLSAENVELADKKCVLHVAKILSEEHSSSDRQNLRDARSKWSSQPNARMVPSGGTPTAHMLRMLIGSRVYEASGICKKAAEQNVGS